MLASCGSDESESSANESESVIIADFSTVKIDRREVSTIKIDNLEVVTEDLGVMNWEDAKRACAELGDGWRMPTKDEFHTLYENKDKIGGFAIPSKYVNSVYWSSTENGSTACVQDFKDGNQSKGHKGCTIYVRAVRSIKSEITTSNESEQKPVAMPKDEAPAKAELIEKDIDIELSLKEEDAWCFIKDIFKKNNDVYIVVDFFNVGVEYIEEEGERWENSVVVNNNPKLRTYKINLENGNEDIYFDSYSEIIDAINQDATCEIETKNGEVIFIVSAGLPG